ncbi:MAG: glycosyltransferase family 9 protein, partial [Candidatus Omnitrophica bacterium]|nr:glycosyltransferase family 9 protein [Candidatus Omnitrophota bacterium]
MSTARHRILIVNPFGIGDVLFSTPLVRAIRRAFPPAHVAYLCNRRTEEILRRNPN